MQLRRIESLNELLSMASAWDDLWSRSESTLPTHRAELVAQWKNHFAGDRPFVALAVEEAGQLIAALPLVIQRKYGLKVAVLTANCWSDCGALLVDPNSDVDAVSRLLVQGERQLGCPLLMLDGIDAENRAWQSWLRTRSNQGEPAVRPKFRVGLIDITHDWDAYVAAWSSNHRRAVKKLRKAIDGSGGARLECLSQLQPDQLEPLLHQAFEIEDRGWKGREGTSVLRSPGAFDFFLRQAQQLCEWNQFELYFLKHKGQPIAFDFCYSSKGVLSSHKIGYDEEFRDFGPFQVLRAMQLEQLFSDPTRRLLDTLGILGEAGAKWSTRYIQTSRVIAPTGDPVGRLAMKGYQHVWPQVRKLLGRCDVEVRNLEPGSARLLQSPSKDDSEAKPALVGV